MKLVRSHISISVRLDGRTREKEHAFEIRCYQWLLNISYKDHLSNRDFNRNIQAALGKHDGLLTLVKKR